MSNLTPVSESMTWQEALATVQQRLANQSNELHEMFKDETNDHTTRLLAITAARVALMAEFSAMLIGSLESWAAESIAELRSLVEQLAEQAELDDTTRADLQERLAQVEYAHFSESQRERLMEWLTGDVLDVIADKLKGEGAS